jgi:hypothetical protein
VEFVNQGRKLVRDQSSIVNIARSCRKSIRKKFRYETIRFATYNLLLPSVRLKSIRIRDLVRYITPRMLSRGVASTFCRPPNRYYRANVSRLPTDKSLSKFRDSRTLRSITVIVVVVINSLLICVHKHGTGIFPGPVSPAPQRAGS